MRYEDWRESENVEDRRGDDSGGSGGYGFPVGAGGFGIGGIIVLGLIGWALGIDPRVLIGGAEIFTRNSPGYQQPYQPPVRTRPNRGAGLNDDTGRFVKKVLAANEDRWKAILQNDKRHRFEPPKLVLFSRQTNTQGCRFAQAAMGPFYCPGDRTIYLDTSFFRDIERRFHGCDVGSNTCRFAQAYVIAHEFGHHVQNLLDILPTAQQRQHAASKVEANHIQVQVELQADCFAGLWAKHQQQTQPFIDSGDVEAALSTASAIGDDTLQRRSQGTVVPDAFTHGSSAQRVRWFKNGFNGATVESCNTFAAAQL